MARYYKDENGNLICTAAGTRQWICTQAEHDRRVAAGTAPNNCMVNITDDYSEVDEPEVKHVIVEKTEAPQSSSALVSGLSNYYVGGVPTLSGYDLVGVSLRASSANPGIAWLNAATDGYYALMAKSAVEAPFNLVYTFVRRA